MNTPVVVLGGFQTDFARVWSREQLDLSDMIRDAARGAIEATGLTAASIGSIHVGNAFGELQRGQGHLAALVSEVVPELWDVPAVRHEGACASSSLALLAATAEIEAGRYDCALVLGVEEQKNLPGDVSSRNQNAAGWVGREDHQCRFLWPSAFGRLSTEYLDRYGADGLDLARLRRSLLRIAELNYSNARRNPLAQTRRWQFDAGSFTDDDELNPLIEPGTRRLDCAQITDGACALVLASPAFAQRHCAATGQRLSDLACIAGWGHRTAAITYESKVARSRGQPFVFPHLRRAIEEAWARAGISGPSDLDVIETHDCFAMTEYMAIDHFGITPPGMGWQVVERGDIAPGGTLPINPSGGLIGVGHPVGATGARLVLDAVRQVTGRAGPCQVEGARRAATLNIGGSCSTAVSFVVSRMG